MRCTFLGVGFGGWVWDLKTAFAFLSPSLYLLLLLILLFQTFPLVVGYLFVQFALSPSLSSPIQLSSLEVGGGTDRAGLTWMGWMDGSSPLSVYVA